MVKITDSWGQQEIKIINDNKLHIIIFNVGLGQCIYVLSEDSFEDNMLIDCGHESKNNFHPINMIINNKWIERDKLGFGKPFIHNLTLTNYDHDHFSGIINLREKVNIKSVSFPKNLTYNEILEMKIEKTEELEHIGEIRNNYTSNYEWDPSFNKYSFYLEKNDLDNPTTNNLSQIVFIEYKNSIICISGDLEKEGWEKILNKEDQVKELLKKTNIFVASHHGRENGYIEEIFEFCKPECIIISDENIKYGTQENMTNHYYNKIEGNGINFEGNRRKVLTTRNDNHIHIVFNSDGSRNYYKK